MAEPEVDLLNNQIDKNTRIICLKYPDDIILDNLDPNKQLTLWLSGEKLPLNNQIAY